MVRFDRSCSFISLCLALSGSALSAEAVWLGGTGDFAEGSGWSGGTVPLETEAVRISSGTASLDGENLLRSATTTLDGGGLSVANASFLQAGTAAARLEISDGRFDFNGPIFSLASRYGSEVVQTGGVVDATVTRGMYFSRSGALSGRRTDFRMDDGLFEVTYAVANPSPSEFQFMGQNGNDTLVINGGLMRFDGGIRRRMDLQRNARIEINGGAFEVSGFSRFSIGRDRAGEASVTVNDGAFRMLESRVDAGGITIGDYTDGRLNLNGGRVEVTPSSTNASSRRSGLIVGRKGKTDTGRSEGTVFQSGGVFDLSGLDLTLGDNVNGSFGGRGRYIMTGGRLLARKAGTWSGGTYQADEPGDSYFFFHAGEIVLAGDQRDWPDQAFVYSRSAIQREYDAVADETRLTAVPDLNHPATHAYFRFSIDRRRGGGSDPREMVQLSEFVLLRDGQAITMSEATVSNPGGSNPSGEEPFRSVDGDTETKWLDFNGEPLVFSFPEPVTVDAYQFVTANDFPDRDPARWTLEGSDDGEIWVVLDRQARNYPISKRRFEASLPFALPATPDAPYAPPVFQLRYLRFQPTATREPEAGVTRLARLEFYRDETRVFPDAIESIIAGGATAAERTRVNDGLVRSEWEERASGGGLEFDFGSEVALDSFLLATGGSDSGADPVRWLMEGSVDGVFWFPLDDRRVRPFGTPSGRYTASAVTAFQPVTPDGLGLEWRGFQDGVWNTSTANWDSAGPTAWRNGGGFIAEFGSLGPKRVDVEGTIEVDGLTVSEPNYRFSGDGPVVWLGNAEAGLAADVLWSVPMEGSSGWRKRGAGAFRLRAPATLAGRVDIEAGALSLDNGSGWSGGSELRVGSGAGSRGQLSFVGAGDYDFASPSSETWVGADLDASGGVLQSAGEVRLGGPASGYLRLGGSAGAYGAWQLQGGRLDASTGGRSGARVGDGGHGVFHQSGGVFLCERWFSIGGDGGAAGASVASFTGGRAELVSTGRIQLAERTGSIGTLNLGTQAGGNAEVVALSEQGIIVGLGDAATRAAVHLNAGTLVLHGPLHRSGSGVEAVVAADGGTLQAGRADIALAAASLSSIDFYRGGLEVATAGWDVTLDTPLRPAEGAGFYPQGGWLAVADGGAGYVGPPLVEVTSSGSGLPPQAIALLEDGVVTRVLMTAPGENLAPGETLSFRFVAGGPERAAPDFTHILSGDELSAERGGLRKTGSGRLFLTEGLGPVGRSRVEAGELALATGSTNEAAIEVGANAVLSGAFNASGDLEIAGRFAPGPAAAEVQLDGELVFASGSVLEIELQRMDAVPGTDYPDIRANQTRFEGSAANPVRVEVDLSALEVAPSGNRDWVLLRSDESSGFSADAVELQLLGAPGGGWWRLQQTGSELRLAYRVEPEGDYLDWLGVEDAGARPSPFDDLNGSGRANLLEYILGGSADQSGLASEFRFDRSDDSSGPVVRFRRRIAGAGLGRQFLESSPDLVEWERRELLRSATDGITVEMIPEQPTMETVIVELDSEEPADRAFIRFVVEPYPEVLP